MARTFETFDRPRTIRDLIDILTDIADEHGDELEVRLAIQPQWAFEHSIGTIGMTKAVHGAKAEPAVVYIAEGGQVGYLPGAAGAAVGWTENHEDDDDDEDDYRPDFDTRDREGLDEANRGLNGLLDDFARVRAQAVCGHQPVGSNGVSCMKPDGHDGDHGDMHDTWKDVQS
jgi:hypothetical protein